MKGGMIQIVIRRTGEGEVVTGDVGALKERCSITAPSVVTLGD
jgi:hypothetical protein